MSSFIKLRCTPFEKCKLCVVYLPDVRYVPASTRSTVETVAGGERDNISHKVVPLNRAGKCLMRDD